MNVILPQTESREITQAQQVPPDSTDVEQIVSSTRDVTLTNNSGRTVSATEDVTVGKSEGEVTLPQGDFIASQIDFSSGLDSAK